MKIHYGFNSALDIPNPVITTGSFDGVHIGHKAILNRINEIAAVTSGESVLITFYPHPRQVLFPETAGKNLLLISSQREKIELLSKTGLDNLVIVEFTKEFSNISSIDFIRNILVSRLHAAKVVIGFNHHFGHNREGDINYLYELGRYYKFGVEEIPEQDIHTETVSSTLIRKALIEGKIQRANAYLDHHYIIMGNVCKGSSSCEAIHFSTFRIPITESSKLVPPDGVYAVSVKIESNYYKGILNIKNSLPPDVRRVEDILIEVHLFEGITAVPPVDRLLDKEVTVFFAKRIRDELEFETNEQMQYKLADDIKEVEELIY